MSRTCRAFLSLCVLYLASVVAANAQCNVTYTITGSWMGGFQAAFSIANTSATAINGWTLQWTFSGNQQITNGWGGTYTSVGPAVTVTNANYDGNIPAGGSVTGMGFVANSTGTNAVPASFAVNGTVCGATNNTPPAAPTGLTATSNSTSSVTLSWTPSPGAVSYNVYRSTVANFTPSASTRIATGVTVTSFADNSVTASMTFFYVVTAVNAFGESAGSNQASASTQLLLSMLSPTTGMVGSSVQISGSSFGTLQGASVVHFGVVTATVTAWSSSAITVTVPNLTLGAVSVTVVVNGVTSNALQFTVTNTPPPTTFTGNATHFDGLGSPFGGCGLPQSVIDSQDFVALNVQDTPGNYTTSLPRPIPAQFASQIGKFNNGKNCGRWVHVVIGNFCKGTNDGAPGQPFCRGGQGWVPDQFNGAALDMVVADSCQDGNAWCRDDPNHLDLATASLNRFILNGQPVGNMDPNFWNNRMISWQFIPAPNYTGDIKIGFIQGANAFWSAIAVAHLQNGIHSVEYFSNGMWTAATMDADLGDDYIILPTVSGGNQYQIRVRDVTDQLINNGRVYLFSFPASCGTQCSQPFTQISYTVQ